MSLNMKIVEVVSKIILDDVKMVKSFKPSVQTPFAIRSQCWSLMDRFCTNLDIGKVLFSSILSISFKGDFPQHSSSSSRYTSQYNESLRMIIERGHVILKDRLVEFNLDWQCILRLMLFNHVDWQISAQSYLLKVMAKNDLYDALYSLFLKRKDKFFPFILLLMQRIQEYLSSGARLTETCEKSLQLMDVLGRICYDKVNGVMLGNSSFWLRVHLFLYNLLKYLSFWQMKQVDVKNIFKKSINTFKEYVKFHRIACSDQKEPRLFYLDWAKESILSIKPWLQENDHHVNFICADVMIDIFQVISEQYNLIINDTWKAELDLDIESIKNQSQKEKLCRYLSINPLKRSAAEEAAFYRYQKAAHIEANDTHTIIGARHVVSGDLNHSSLMPTTLPQKGDFLSTNVYGSTPPISTKSLPGIYKNIQPPISIAPKIPIYPRVSKISRANSKMMQKLQQEHAIERTLIASTVAPPPEVKLVKKPDPKPEIAIKDDFIPRRPVKVLELSTVNKSGRGPSSNYPLTVGPSNVASRLINVKKLFATVLGWEVSSNKSMMGKNAESLVRVPDAFKDAENYIRVFEPLFIEEMQTRFCQSVEEARSRSARIGIVLTIRNVDSLHGTR